jgi:hypothetical protein
MRVLKFFILVTAFGCTSYKGVYVNVDTQNILVVEKGWRREIGTIIYEDTTSIYSLHQERGDVLWKDSTGVVTMEFFDIGSSISERVVKKKGRHITDSIGNILFTNIKSTKVELFESENEDYYYDYILSKGDTFIFITIGQEGCSECAYPQTYQKVKDLGLDKTLYRSLPKRWGDSLIVERFKNKLKVSHRGMVVNFSK